MRNKYLLFCCITLFPIYGIHCSPVPSSSAQNETLMKSTTTVNAPSSQDETLDCIMEVMQVLISNGEEKVSESCRAMLMSLHAEERQLPDNITTITTTIKKAMPTSDLTSELQDLTSQLQDIRNDNNIKKDGKVEDPKSSDQLDDDSLSKSTNKQPFTTSVQENADNYVVIPLEFLKSRVDMENWLNEAVSYDDNSNAFSPISSNPMDVNSTSEIVEKSLDEKPGEEDAVMQDGEEAKTERSMEKKNSTGNQLEALKRMAQDIQSIDEDFKMLEKNYN